MKMAFNPFIPRFSQKEIWKGRILPVAAGLIGTFALILLIMLSLASSNTQFFDNYFIGLYAANIIIGASLTLVILSLIHI